MALQHRRITLLVKYVYNVMAALRRMIATAHVPTEDPLQSFARTGTFGQMRLSQT